jgi:hypothetical protein
MARAHVSPEGLRKIRELAAHWGQIVARRAFGDQGPGLDVDLTAMEEVAQAAADGLTQGVLTTLLQQQARTLGTQQPCPDCGRLCTLAVQPRQLKVRTGQLEHQEPAAYCPDCRRDFFPPTAGAAP